MNNTFKQGLLLLGLGVALALIPPAIAVHKRAKEIDNNYGELKVVCFNTMGMEPVHISADGEHRMYIGDDVVRSVNRTIVYYHRMGDVCIFEDPTPEPQLPIPGAPSLQADANNGE